MHTLHNVHGTNNTRRTVWEHQASELAELMSAARTYTIRLINVSRFMDISRLHAFLKAIVAVPFEMEELDVCGPRSHTSNEWEVKFKLDGCPDKLKGIKRINWFRTRIIVRQFIEAIMEEIRERNIIRLGRNMEETTDKVRWRFRRTAIWERDQHVTAIHAPPGHEYPKRLSVAQRFAATWKPLFSTSHKSVTNEELSAAIDRFVSIPEERKVTRAINQALLAPIDEDELTQAVRALQRQKAAGPDGLNNVSTNTLQRRLYRLYNCALSVNGEMSEPVLVNSGIRQGALSPPLLFILGAEVLGLAITQDEAIVGITLSAEQGAPRYKFSAFVGDSTIFLENSSQLRKYSPKSPNSGSFQGYTRRPTRQRQWATASTPLSGSDMEAN
ncbi:unnamed protein product [Phytophthora fragariaefolia]|uniref:Unnamed protein product n=1 Tax=Phytophthora fragariaefolia TaxID=1490495 RepID=A0A9W7CNW0_9STRA|nr:unnamed protein product [Phytophthora fragariaefolia]